MTRNEWIERGSKFPKREGYVCIGKYDGGKDLTTQLGLPDNSLFSEGSGGWHHGMSGNSTVDIYYVTQGQFDELFPTTEQMKYYIKALSTEHSCAIQTRLFELGYRWMSGKKNLFDTKTIQIDGKTLYNSLVGQEITFDDLFKAPFIFSPIEVKLNGGYTAVVHKDKVVVGCQTFTHEVIEKLAEAVKAANS